MLYRMDSAFIAGFAFSPSGNYLYYHILCCLHTVIGGSCRFGI